MRKNKKQVVQQLSISAYAAEGKSLGRKEGKVIFVERTVPGDVVDVVLFKNKADWAEGMPTQFHQLSADRVEPFCAHFGICGGCVLQMLPYTMQLQYKQQQVYDQLTRIGGVSVQALLPIIGAEQTTAYRNKLEFTFATRRFLSHEELKDPTISGEGQFAGFHARGFFDKIVDIHTCHLAEDVVNQIREVIKTKVAQLGMPFYHINQQTGWIRGVQYRICTTGHLMVNIIVHYQAPELQTLLQHLQQEVPQITSLFYTINPKQNDSIANLVPAHAAGMPYAVEKLEDFEFIISPKSFFQTNTRQAEKLYQVARNFAELDGTQTVYDLYCGTGSIGIFVSRQAHKVIGVEVVEDAVKDARINAERNKVTHAHFFAGDVIDVCTTDFFANHGKPDVIITDPPRAGMHDKLVQKILEIAAPTVVYVSCNPATQARDLKLLNHLYEVTKCQPVDMFPHTHHIENVVQLKLRK
ncbi:MAG TPA: 23S rRNA (uracil(1939)-C(5))-methyltransferase RlmD [Phnomibacter sp.]|nr:23S rRNA (uracil(1939)-C(5))-methyltransferase RlmD [Phnomibacter sp.]